MDAAQPAPARRWTAVTRPEGRVDRRALLGLRADPDEVRAWPRPGIVEGCTGCGTCVRVCPTGALTEARLPTTMVLGVHPTACTGCGECVARCPEKVLAPAVTVPGPHADRPVRLARVRLSRCGRCRGPLSPGEADLCSSCRAREALVRDIWSSLA